LDELNAHRFYEAFNNTHTVRELRDKLREIGWEKRPMMFPFAVFACLEYKADWHYVVNAPQGDNSEEIAKAQKLLDEAINALNAAAAAADAAAAAAQAASQAATEAKKKAEESAAREAELKTAKAEVQAALDEVKSQEDARERKTKDLTEKSQGTGVKAGMAKQELAQHLGADPLPLRKAKITLEAANRKAQKAADAATVAREAAEAAAVEAAKKAKEAAAKQKEAEAAAKAAEAARVDAEEKAAEAEAARVDAEEKAVEAARTLEVANQKVKEAEQEIERIKALPGQAYGLLKWMEMELQEALKFKSPKARANMQ